MMSLLRRLIKAVIDKKRIGKTIYLLAATFVTIGLSLCIIFVVNMLIPFLQVKHYKPTACTTVNSSWRGGWRFTSVGTWPFCPASMVSWIQNRMSYPCLTIVVSYRSAEGNQFTSMIHENEFVLYDMLEDKKNCTYTRCGPSTGDNQRAIYREYLKYGKPGTTFDCLYDPINPMSVILRTYHTYVQVLEMTVISAGFVVLGFLIILITYGLIGCDIWSKRISTVQWERRLKTIEMEAEMTLRAAKIAADASRNNLAFQSAFDMEEQCHQ
ncbi:uncharacterized protein LOC141909018 [Tubulanus polymorphus]|uniref:uncharacterized protein LOC141909018 n=1 Tax=Tubulanus polymorphus TaxID=672921 RepID=UPI003DA52422